MIACTGVKFSVVSICARIYMCGEFVCRSMDASTARRAPDVPVRGRPPAQQRSAHSTLSSQQQHTALTLPPTA